VSTELHFIAHLAKQSEQFLHSTEIIFQKKRQTIDPHNTADPRIAKEHPTITVKNQGRRQTKDTVKHILQITRLLLLLLLFFITPNGSKYITDTTNTNTIKHTTSYEMLHMQLGNELSLNNKRDTIKS